MEQLQCFVLIRLTSEQIAKRAGEQEPDAAFRMDILGTTYNLRLKRSEGLVAAGAKVVIHEGDHTFTQRVTNSSYPVAWLGK